MNPRARLICRWVPRPVYKRAAGAPGTIRDSPPRSELPHHEAALTANWLPQLPLATLPRWLPRVFSSSRSCFSRSRTSRPRRSSTPSSMPSPVTGGLMATPTTDILTTTTETMATTATMDTGTWKKHRDKGRRGKKSAESTSRPPSIIQELEA